MRWIRRCGAVAALLVSPSAWADPPAVPTSSRAEPSALLAPAPPEDRTGGAYTSPTLLFVPAAAVPAWNARVLLSTEVQGPADVHAGFRPGLGAELGLPAGFTVGAGTNWVGGDVNPTTGARDFSLGLSPYVQGRLHVYGDANGRGVQLGTSVTYKRVGFGEEPGEVELAFSSQYRAARYELGLQGVVGKGLEGDDVDGEVHTYALYRVVPELGLGAAGQVRCAFASEATEKTYDLLGGTLASLTLGRYQIGALGGASTLGLAKGSAGALGQLFATARF